MPMDLLILEALDRVHLALESLVGIGLGIFIIKVVDLLHRVFGVNVKR